MPVKLNVGLSKKMGLPDYGSLGASCHIEVDLTGTSLENDLDGFHSKVARAFNACRQAVADELARHQLNGQQQPANASFAQAGTIRSANPGAGTNGNGHGDQTRNGGSAIHHASTKQLEYARQLAGQIRGLGIRKLETLAVKTFGKPVAGLSSLNASGLIDTLKAIKAGNIDLNVVMNGDGA
jgi:hypothetical protein